jgi:anti-anti-sigma factor
MSLVLIANDEDVLRLYATGKIMHAHSADEPDQLRTFTGPDGYGRRVLVNLEQVSFIDSSGIGWLLSVHKRFQNAGGKLILHTLPESIQLTLKILRLDAVLNIAETEADARALAARTT